MSERSYSGNGARSNPLYGTGSRTPSWQNKQGGPRTSTYSEAASSPPDSPTRSQSGSQYYPPQYEHPGYTVQTPGHDLGGGTTPYGGGAPYYVQTPAPSEMQRTGPNGSPFSSAPPSPPHSMGTAATPFDARSTRSGRSRGSSRALNVAAPADVDEDEEEEFFPDVERDAWRRRRALKCFCTVFGIFVLFLLFCGAITANFLLKPQPPTYQYEGATVNQFYATNGYDASGLPTTQLYANLSFALSTFNPNRFFRTVLEGGDVSVGYNNIAVFARGKLPNITTPIKQYRNWSMSVATMAFPLYGAGPLLTKAIEDRYVSLTVNINITASVPIVWKLIQPKFSKVLICTVNIDPYSYQFINETCAVPIKTMSLI